MDRKYKSGAEKRKLKAEKKQNDENLLSKIPKLTSIFQVKNVDNDSNSSTGDQHADSTTQEKNCPAKTIQFNQLQHLKLLHQKLPRFHQLQQKLLFQKLKVTTPIFYQMIQVCGQSINLINQFYSAYGLRRVMLCFTFHISKY